MTSLNQTAILVFSRYASEEAYEKKYYKYIGRKHAVELAGQLINHTLTEAKATGLPVHIFYTDSQEGQSFGERLANAIGRVFDSGASNLVIIGSDSPTITSTIISRAAVHLNNHSGVIAPSEDGGVYLIGLTKKTYDRCSFINVPWLTANVSNALEQYFLLLQTPLHKEVCGEDVDNITNALDWCQYNPTHFLSVIFRQILSYLKRTRIFETNTDFVIEAFCTKILLRGPPQIA